MPTGTPPVICLISATRRARSASEWMSGKWAGEWTSLPAITPRAAAISAVTFEPSRVRPNPGFAPCPILISIACAAQMFCSVQPK